MLFVSFIALTEPNLFGQRKSSEPKKVTSTTSKCQLTEAPKLRGFYLGQTVDEIQKIVPDFREAYELQKKTRNFPIPLSDWRKEIDETISSEIDLVYFDGSRPFGTDSNREILTSTDYEDVNIIWWFIKEKLFAYGVYYSELDVEQDAAKFLKQVSAKTTLPQKGWILSDIDANLRCNGFKVYLNAGYRNVPHLIFTDTNIEEEILRSEKAIKVRKIKEEQERLRIEREKRSIFKP